MQERVDCTVRDWSRECGLPPEFGGAAWALVATVLGSEEHALAGYRAAHGAGASESLLDECARMAHLFAGFPRAIQGLHARAAVRSKPAAAESAEESRRDRAADRERGRALFERIYGEHSERVLGTLEHALPGYSRWILEHAYGRVLARSGISAVQRELLAVAALDALDCPDQRASHVRGALRLGASEAQVEAMRALAQRQRTMES